MLVPAGLLFLSAGLIVAANLQSGFDAAHPKPTSILYHLDADTGTAAWVSLDAAPDAWTAQFLGAPLEQRPFEIVPGTTVPSVSSAAPALALAPPIAEVLSDTTTDGLRTLRLRVTSPRQPWATSITAQADSGIRAVTVAGHRVDLASEPPDQRTTWSMNYAALPAGGVELTLELAPGAPITLLVSDIAHGLPEIPGTTVQPRPAEMMPAPIDVGDATLVRTTFRY